MSKWNSLPSDQTLKKTVSNMQERGFNPQVVETGAEALEKVKSLIPKKAEVMTGSSTTLKEIGLMDYLSSTESPWKNVQADVWSENDTTKREKLRRKSVTSEYYLASANAVAETGELVFVDASGSRVTALPYAAEHVILVIGTQKIAKSVEEAMNRIREHVFPLEDKRALAAYGANSAFGKWLIIEREFTPNRITVIFVKEVLGF